MVGSAHAGEKVQEGALVLFHQAPECVLAPQADKRHESEIIGFGLDGIRHEEAFLNQFREKEKSFGSAPRQRDSDSENIPNRRRVSGAYTKTGRFSERKNRMKKWIIGCGAIALAARAALGAG